MFVTVRTVFQVWSVVLCSPGCRGQLFISCSLWVLAACGQSRPVNSSILSWQAANGGLTPHVAVTSIAVDPRPPQQIFTGVYAEESLYASADGSVTWQHDGDGVAGQPVFALLFDPQQADVL